MIVVAIVGILAAVAIPQFSNMVRKAQEGQTKGNLGSLRSAISIYYTDNEGQYPLDQLESVVASGFLHTIPPAFFPTYHPASSLIALQSQGAQNDGYVGYYYDDCNALCATCHQQDVNNWGRIVLSCSHTDLKGVVWSTY